jgi:inosine-uridine nucleoside N-ribohydrolase
MSVDRRKFLVASGATLSSLPFLKGSTLARAIEPLAVQTGSRRTRKVIYDQDHRGPLSTDTVGTLMLLQAENVEILGITTVTGDQWVKQETAYALRLLELMDRTDIPVFMGAREPLLNTKAEAQKRYEMFGARKLEGFLGAFNKDHWGPDEVKPLPPPYNEFAKLKAQPEHAVDFIIRTVRANPGQVTIYCGGPLTNLALAVMMAPDIVPLTEEVVFMGGGLHHSTSSFNVYFDSEAAKIAFRAPWPKFTVVTVDIAEQVHMGDDGRVDAIVERAHSPIKELFRDYEQKPHRDNPNLRWFRMPDEMMAAQIIDPSIFTAKQEMFVDVLTDNDGHYGDTFFWDADWNSRPPSNPTAGQNGPSPKAGKVQVLMELDKQRFKDLFIDLMTKPIRK